jgi:hypothetical protein
MPYRVVLNGSNVTNIVMDGSVEISDIIEGRSVCRFSIRDNGKTIHTTPGESVFVTWYGARIFGGSVETAEESAPDKESALFLKIRAVDFTSLADRYTVNNRYENDTVREIVTDIVNNQTGLALDGVTLDDVQDGVPLSIASFNHLRASDCFRDISNTTGMSWNINAYKVFQFFDRATYIAPFNIGDANPIHREFNYTKTRGQYRNKQILRAGKDKTIWQFDYLRGSSAAPEAGGTGVDPEKRVRTFILKYDLAELRDTGSAAPYNLWIKRGTVIQRVGIKGIDEDDDLTVGSKEINQNSAEDEGANPTMLPTERLEVQYKGSFPIILDVESYDEIQARKAIEGGSGEYQHVESDEAIDGLDFANEKANTLLARYGRIPNEISYGTDTPGLMAGMIQTNRFAIHGLADTQFLINEVRIKIMPGPFLRCSVKAIDGEQQDGWTDYFRRQWLAGRKFTIRENEKIAISKTSNDTATIMDTLTESVHNSVTLNVWSEDPFNWAIVGSPFDSVYQRALPGCIVGRSKIGLPYGL